MEYRYLPKTHEKISVIGMGASSIAESDHEEMVKTIKKAIANGINYFDMAAGSAKAYKAYGEAFEGVRDQVLLQVHFGADYTSGEYGWTLDKKRIENSVRWQLEQLKTDYIDFGMIHCLDEIEDLERYQKNGVLDLLIELKKRGVIRHLGLSTHSIELANAVLDLGLIDLLMFSINPAYDFNEGDYATGESHERMDLYRRCEANGVGISVMKAFGGGKLLSDDLSPFHHALTPIQCIQYALDKPAVLTVLPGIRNEHDLDVNLAYLNADPQQKDYSFISDYTPNDFVGTCVYCSHCQPCPVGLEIALINKYYDLAKMGDTLARDHYLHLEKHASDCVQCEHCNHRCPFHVDQMKRMQEIAAYFQR